MKILLRHAALCSDDATSAIVGVNGSVFWQEEINEETKRILARKYSFLPGISFENSFSFMTQILIEWSIFTTQSSFSMRVD